MDGCYVTVCGNAKKCWLRKSCVKKANRALCAEATLRA